MKKKQTVAALIFAAALSVNSYAYAYGNFVCMRNEETTAITNDENGNLRYIELRDSKGALVAPQISSDGNTYLPFRYICDITGIADGNNTHGELNDNSYRFVDGSVTDKIEIKYNGVYRCHNIGELFDYTAPDGSTRSVAIYNIRGTLYAPMGYLASLTGAQAVWDERFSRIMFIDSGTDRSLYLNPDNSLRRDKEMQLGYEVFNNNLTDSPLYLDTDGMSISYNSHGVRGVFRNNNHLYWTTVAGTLETTHEYTGMIETVVENCDSAFGLKDRIYGIKTLSQNSGYGRLFSCDRYGGDFKYLTENDVYNLIVTNIDNDYTLYYCDAQTRSTLHMIRVNTMDDYEIQITDFEHNNLLPEIKQFAVGLKSIYCLDTAGNFHVIDLDFPLSQASIARLKSGSVIHTHASDGTALDNITSMNYDYINDVVYIIQSGNDNRIFYYSPLIGQFNHLITLDCAVNGLSLFYDAAYTNRLAVKTADGNFDVRTEFNNGIVTVKE